MLAINFKNYVVTSVPLILNIFLSLSKPRETNKNIFHILLFLFGGKTSVA